ncbi:formylglycine-generating enzyme family protein, partial [Saprospiraceae bacterium]|nr:formylglycine-generating enzyme family protein [Saprospiraceae bacterium]
WLSVMKRNPSNFKGGSLPVDQVSWNDVQDFLKRLNSKTDQNYRLPTEIEWEFAARGGTNSQAYEFAGSNSLEKVGWYALNSGNRTHPVGEKEPNELGIFDMSGNVWEWCQDWYGRSRKKDKTNPKEPRNGKRRVLRGGCWGSNTEGCQVSNRGGNDPDSRINICGFRIAQSV